MQRPGESPGSFNNNFKKEDGMKKFDNLNEDFDKRMAQARRGALITSIFCLTIIISVLGFSGWAIVMVMKHFGII